MRRIEVDLEKKEAKIGLFFQEDDSKKLE